VPGLHELLPREKTAPPAGDAIVVEALAKRYPNGTDAVRGISFRVAAGAVFGRRDVTGG